MRQVVYRIWYGLRARIAPIQRKEGIDCNLVPVSALQTPFLTRSGLFNPPQEFTFLNLRHRFEGPVDWDYSEFGKLWTYNLNYFDYLLDEQLEVHHGLNLMNEFMESVEHLKNANEPYTISLRVFNWLKFLQLHNIQDPRYIRFVVSDLNLLSRQPEYHLMGKHLLENACALYFGGLMTGLEKYSNQGKALLRQELHEQILSDGGHFERSPMYHLILMERLLDCLNVGIQQDSDDDFIAYMQRKTTLMVRWICSFSFNDSNFAHMNDSTDGISRSIPELVSYASALGVHKSKWNRLNDSGYRKLHNISFEMLVDLGPVGPDYIPGHAHSDSLSFVLHHKDQPIFVDTGTSTYEANDIRRQERSTAAHNTVMVSGKEQSEVWGAFRVARRARVMVMFDTGDSIKARHNGYKRIGAEHTRDFTIEPGRVVIMDKVTGSIQNVAYLHVHPDQQILKHDENTYQVGELEVSFTGHECIELQSYSLALGFNNRVEASKFVIRFERSLTIEIREI